MVTRGAGCPDCPTETGLAGSHPPRTPRAGGFDSEKAVSHEKAQKAQRKEGFAVAEILTGSGTTITIPLFSSCAFCALLWPSTAVFRITRAARQRDNAIPRQPLLGWPLSAQSRRELVRRNADATGARPP